MGKVEKISFRQYVFLIFSIFTIPITFSSPLILIGQLKQDVWQALIIAYLMDAALAIVFSILGLRYPGQTMVQYSETVLGPWIGKMIGLLFVLFFIGTAGLTLSAISGIIYVVMMPETPIVVFSLAIILVSAYAVNAGLEVFARLSEIIGPILIFSILMVVLLNLTNTNLENLLPQFQHSVSEVLVDSFLPASLFGLCVSMGMLMAHLNIPKKGLIGKWTAITMGIILALASYLQMIAVLGVNMIKNQTYPMYRLAQMIHIGDIVERLESVLLIFWIAGSFVAICTLYWSSTVGMSQILKIKKYQKLTPYLGGAILLISTFSFRSASQELMFLRDIFPIIALSIENIPMILLLIVSFVRHGRKTIYAGKEGK